MLTAHRPQHFIQSQQFHVAVAAFPSSSLWGCIMPSVPIPFGKHVRTYDWRFRVTTCRRWKYFRTLQAYLAPYAYGCSRQDFNNVFMYVSLGQRTFQRTQRSAHMILISQKKKRRAVLVRDWFEYTKSIRFPSRARDIDRSWSVFENREPKSSGRPL
jgi:hypothetical protein